MGVESPSSPDAAGADPAVLDDHDDDDPAAAASAAAAHSTQHHHHHEKNIILGNPHLLFPLYVRPSPSLNLTVDHHQHFQLKQTLNWIIMTKIRMKMIIIFHAHEKFERNECVVMSDHKIESSSPQDDGDDTLYFHALHPCRHF